MRGYKRFEYEILLEVNEALLQSNNTIIQKAILHLKKSHLYQDLKLHQETMLAFFSLNDLQFLEKYLHWRYRVYHFRQIDTDYLLYEYQFWKNIILKCVDSYCLHSFGTLYDWMIENHQRLKSEAISFEFPPLSPLEKEFFEASIGVDFEKLVKIAESYCLDLKSFCDFFSTTIVKVTQFIGFSWEINKLSVSKEHLSSENIEKLALYLLGHFEKKKGTQNTIMVAGVAGEYHSLGLKIAVWILEKLGMKVINFGSNTPSHELEIACVEFNPPLIIFSASLFSNIIEVENIILKFNENKNITGKIAISGGAFLSLERPLESLSCDFYIKDYKELFELVLVN